MRAVGVGAASEEHLQPEAELLPGEEVPAEATRVLVALALPGATRAWADQLPAAATLRRARPVLPAEMPALEAQVSAKATRALGDPVPREATPVLVDQ